MEQDIITLTKELNGLSHLSYGRVVRLELGESFQNRKVSSISKFIIGSLELKNIYPSAISIAGERNLQSHRKDSGMPVDEEVPRFFLKDSDIGAKVCVLYFSVD